MRRSERDIQSGSEKGALPAGKQKELLRVGAALRYAGLQPDVSGAGNDLHHRKQAGGGSFCPASGGDHRDLCHRADGSAAAEGGSAPLFPLRGRRRAAGASGGAVFFGVSFAGSGVFGKRLLRRGVFSGAFPPLRLGDQSGEGVSSGTGCAGRCTGRRGTAFGAVPGRPL